MPAGKIRSLTVEKGFGFIESAAHDADIFFHRSAVQGDFAALARGQSVEFEFEENSEKPRAKQVIPGPPLASHGLGLAARPRQSDVSDRGAPPSRQYQYGWVTKLYRNALQGFILPEEGGPELFFEARNVSGDKRFSQLEPGNNVKFVPGPEVNPGEQRVAEVVMAYERPFPSARLSKGRHPRARGKKPTWRS